MAIERGTLQHLLFDNRALASHRAMAAVLGITLALPPIKPGLLHAMLRQLGLILDDLHGE